MRALFSAVVATAAFISAAAAEDVESDFQAWNAIAIAGPVQEDSRFLVWFDGHARFRDDASDLGVSILRPAVGWRATDNLDLWVGYARVVSRSEDAPNVEENRVWQQATYPIVDLFGGNFAGRTRLEQRFRDTGVETGWRLRQFVRWGRPIAGDWSAVVWDELFINLNDADWGQQDGFDQNRIFVGAGLQVTDWGRFEAGYLNNILNVPGQDDHQVNHNLSLAFFVNL